MAAVDSGSVGGLFLLLLLLVVIFAGLARVLRVPYPILLVISGIALSMVPHMPRFALPPDVVFLVFLPPLLYSAAWTLSWREFQRNFAKIAMLALGLVLATILVLSAGASTFLPGFDWKSGLLLGAVVAATDAIAATAIARRIGLPHSIVSLLEAESLINDGTGLLALQFGLAVLATGTTPSFIEGVGQLLFLTGGGVFVGLVVGFLVAHLEKFIDDGPIEIVLSLLMPYGAYIFAQAAHVSGVMAVIACGMYMSRQSVAFMSAEVRLQSTAFWDALTFALNGVVFLLLGLQLPFVVSEIRGIPLHLLVLYGAGFSAAMIAMRMAWVFLEPSVSNAIGTWIFHSETAAIRDKKQLLVVGWGGMRGVLSLAAAVSLPVSTSTGPFQQRSLIIYLAFCLIFSTLVLQGLSLPLLIRKLGLAGHAASIFEEQEARRMMLQEAVTHLSRRRSRERYDSAVLDDLMWTYQKRLEAFAPRRPTSHRQTQDGQLRRQAILDVLTVERETLLRLRDEQRLDDEVLRSLQKELDLSESRVHTSVA